MEAVIKTYRERTKNIKKETRRKIKRRIHKEITKNEKTQEGITGFGINYILSSTTHFAGVFAQDELSTLEIKTLPVSLIINIDYSNQSGSHWIGVKISETTVEVFDSLGFNRTKKLFNPVIILNFLRKYGNNRQYFASPALQPDISSLCGFYSVYFILTSAHISFRDSLSIFSKNLTNNDQILMDILKHI